MPAIGGKSGECRIFGEAHISGPGILWARLSIAAVALGTALAPAGAAADPALTTIYRFDGTYSGGTNPSGPLAFYTGTVFKLTP